MNKCAKSLLIFITDKNILTNNATRDKFTEAEVCAVVDHLCPPQPNSQCVLYDPGSLMPFTCAQQSLATFLPNRSLTTKNTFTLDTLVETEERVENFRSFENFVIFCTVDKLSASFKTELCIFILNLYQATNKIPVVVLPQNVNLPDEIFVGPTFKPVPSGDNVHYDIERIGICLDEVVFGESSKNCATENVSYSEEATHWRSFHQMYLNDQILTCKRFESAQQEILTAKYPLLMSRNGEFIDLYFTNLTNSLTHYHAASDTLIDFCDTWKDRFNEIYRFIHPPECVFYDAEFLRKNACPTSDFVSLPDAADQIQVFSRKSGASDFLYRELVFENMCINGQIIIPKYPDEQKNRQVLRFLISYKYRVFNNSPVVDLIWAWLCVKAHFLAQNFEPQQAYVVTNTYIKALSAFFKNSDKGSWYSMCNDNFDTLVERVPEIGRMALAEQKALKVTLCRLYSVSDYDGIDVCKKLYTWAAKMYGFKSVEDGNISTSQEEEEVDYSIFVKLRNPKSSISAVTLPQSTHPITSPRPTKLFCKVVQEEIDVKKLNLDHNNPVLVDSTNWPKNLNLKVPNDKLVYRSSLPLVVAEENTFCSNFARLAWMKYLKEATDFMLTKKGLSLETHPDALIIKGGAIIDMMIDKTPKDYDIFNTVFSVAEMVQLITIFCKKLERPSRTVRLNVDVDYRVVQVHEGTLYIFQTSFKINKFPVVLEFVVNYNLRDRNSRLIKSYLPDQIYADLKGTVWANEYTLWCLNHGACPISLNEHPSFGRMARKMRGTGFSFFFTDDEVKFTTTSRDLQSKFVYMNANHTSGEGSFCDRKENIYKIYARINFPAEDEPAKDGSVFSSVDNNYKFYTNKSHFIDFIEKTSSSKIDPTIFLSEKMLEVAKLDNFSKGLNWNPNTQKEFVNKVII